MRARLAGTRRRVGRSTSAARRHASERDAGRSGPHAQPAAHDGSLATRANATRARVPAPERSIVPAGRTGRTAGRRASRAAIRCPPRQPQAQRQRLRGVRAGSLDRRHGRCPRAPRLVRDRPEARRRVRSTAIRLPGRSHARGVANASSRPRASRPARASRGRAAAAASRGTRRCSRRSAAGTSRGGARPPSGATLAASPETNVPGVIAAASCAVEARATSWSASSLSARKRATLIP